jgi:hypothetical protein
MVESEYTFKLILGAGGELPGIAAVSPDGCETADHIKLPTGHSVYAVDVDAERGLVAAGTRAGRIELLAWQQAASSTELRPIQSLIQGAPVLSVCLLGDTHLASTDTTGRCLLWHLQQSTATPEVWTFECGAVCALCSLPDGRLLGLTTEGGLLCWDGARDQWRLGAEGPAPPERLALVRLRYWPAQHAVVYPSAEGHLVVCELDGLRVHACEAHEGGFYAIMVNGDRLGTIGTHDGLLKTWLKTSGPLSEHLRAPRGIISGEICLNASPRLLLVSSAGEAAVYEADSGCLEPLHRLVGNHFRTAAGPAPEAWQALAEKNRLAEARQLRTQIQERLSAGHTDDMEELHQRLVAIDFESLSLGLRADQAVRQGDLITELCVRQRLARTLPQDDRRGVLSLGRYATTLEATWRLAEARGIRAGLSTEDRDAEALDWLTAAAGFMAGEDWVVEPDVSIPLLIEAATVMDQPFTGRWAVEVSSPIPFTEGGLTAATLAAKYEQLKTEGDLPGLPVARAQMLRWLSRRTTRKIEVVVFTHTAKPPGAGLQPAVQVLGDGLQSDVVPCVLFTVPPPRPRTAALDHNRHAYGAYEKISQRKQFDPWPEKVRRTLSLALRRLRNQARTRGARREEAACSNPT